MLKKLLITICLSFILVTTVYAFPPMPMYYWNSGRDVRVLAMTNGGTQTAITEDQLSDYSWISIQGASAETDIQLVAVSYYALARLVNDEAYVMEICPPTGELLYLDGTALDANDCVDSDGVVGSMASAVRYQIGDGTWHWHILSITGAWTDAAGTD